MNPKYEIGQRVVIRQVSDRLLSLRDCTIEPYVGQIGEVVNYYAINPRSAQVFYLYLVRLGADYHEIALHEDEIESYIK